MSRRLRPSRRTGFVIVAVLIAGVSGIWIATSLLFLMQSDVRAAEVTLARTQHRSLGLSGLRLLADVLVEQREDLLAGVAPVVEDQYSLWDQGNREAVVRLLPVGPGGSRLVSEAGRVDINHATADRLAAIPLLTQAQAEAIVAHREAMPGKRFHSLHDLLAIESISVADLLGELSDEHSMDQAAGDSGDLRERVEQRLMGGTPRGLMDVLTVHGFEPNLQRSGRRRIDLNVPWSDELAQRVTERFGDGTARSLEQLFKQTDFDEDSKIVAVLRQFNVPTRNWSEPLDALTTLPNVHVAGRLDINQASIEALQSLPGVDHAIAQRLVAERDSLDEDERATITWLLLRDVLTPETFESLPSLITVRSWTWRVRIAAGTVAADDPDGPIEHAVIYEAVIDLADPQPRLGYLREITMLQTSAMLAAALEAEAIEAEPVVGDPLADFAIDPMEGDATLDDLDTVAGLDDLATRDDLATLDDVASFDEATDEEVASKPPPSGRVGRWMP